jgi:hypothetical protein
MKSATARVPLWISDPHHKARKLLASQEVLKILKKYIYYSNIYGTKKKYNGDMF